MTTQDSLFGLFAKQYDTQKEAEMSLEDYLKACAREPMAYASAAERMIAAIGEPEMVDTSTDSRLGRIFMNRTIRIYPAFADDFFGMEETIERIVGYFRHAAQGLEERKQVLYLLGPGRRRQILARRAPQGADGKDADLCLEGGQGDEPDLREPLGPVRPDHHGRHAREAIQDPEAPSDRPASAPGR